MHWCWIWRWHFCTLVCDFLRRFSDSQESENSRRRVRPVSSRRCWSCRPLESFSVLKIVEISCAKDRLRFHFLKTSTQHLIDRLGSDDVNYMLQCVNSLISLVCMCCGKQLEGATLVGIISRLEREHMSLLQAEWIVNWCNSWTFLFWWISFNSSAADCNVHSFTISHSLRVEVLSHWTWEIL